VFSGLDPAEQLAIADSLDRVRLALENLEKRG
jgi:hypothetical protein